MTLLTVLRELNHVVENGAVSIKGTHPGERHAAAVGGIESGHKILRGMRQLAVRGKQTRETKQHRIINLHCIQLHSYRQLKAHDVRLV